MPRIYISHRPEDSSRNEVRVIRERLIAEFGDDNVMDTAGDHMDTTLELQAMVESCDVLLVVIGRYWLNMVDEQGNNLLADPYDPVHIELYAGQDSVRLIQVLLVDGVAKPGAQALPEVLRWLVRHNTASAETKDDLNDFVDTFIEQVDSPSAPTGKQESSRSANLIRLEPEIAPPPPPAETHLTLPSNTSYRSPAERSTIQQQDTPPIESSSSNQWGMAILIGAIFLGFILAFVEDDGQSSLPNADAVHFEPTSAPIQATPIREATDTPSNFSLVWHFSMTDGKVGFSIFDDTSLYYEHNGDLYIIDVDANSLNPLAVRNDDLVFENIIRPEPESFLIEEQIDHIESEFNDEVLFAWLDGDDIVYDVVLTDKPRIVLIAGGDIIASRRILEPIDNVIIPNQTVVYDPTYNRLMLLANDAEIMTWRVDDEPTLLWQDNITHDNLKSVVRILVSPTGEYLVAVGSNGFSIYRIAESSPWHQPSPG